MVEWHRKAEALSIFAPILEYAALMGIVLLPVKNSVVEEIILNVKFMEFLWGREKRRFMKFKWFH